MQGQIKESFAFHWCSKTEVEKMLSSSVTPASYVGKYHYFNSDYEITIEDIQDAILKVAQLTYELGMGVELFEYLKQALEDRKSKKRSMDEIMMMINEPFKHPDKN